MAAGKGLGNASGHVPGEDAPGHVAAEEGLGVFRPGQRHCWLGVALDALHGLGGALVKVVEVTAEAKADNEVALPEAADLLVVDLLAKLDGLDSLLGGGVPDLASLVGRGGNEVLAVVGPGEGEDGAGVGSIATKLAGLLAGLAIVEEGLAVGTGSDIEVAVRAKAHAVDEAGVVLAGLLELEGRTLIVVGAKNHKGEEKIMI